ncbi:hypothetical protein RHMOL_Rhmol11G0133300 [Rhododendron molle]|uniref:Uncharacterized protein n=1 Tax=Rhododendron molle TaxID=49168 RepID=A0ACC0LTB8_RHOML|nr:hypothetical protein RHMOL_Rhmol11G0133300 [Rhododendron molle]
MGKKPGETVVGSVGAKGGGGATEGNPVAGAARTKSAGSGSVPAKRKTVKKMMGKAIVSCFCSTNQNETHAALISPVNASGCLAYLLMFFIFKKLLVTNKRP